MVVFEVVDDLLARVDAVAEIPQALRAPSAVERVPAGHAPRRRTILRSQVSCMVVTQVGSSTLVGEIFADPLTPSWLTTSSPEKSRGSQKPMNPLS